MYSLEDMDPDDLEPHMEGLPLGLQLLESLLQSIGSGDGSKPKKCGFPSIINHHHAWALSKASPHGI